MSSYYTYLISSLPMLHFGSKPAINLNDFINRCSQFIPEHDFNLVKQVTSVDAYALELPENNILRKWKEFDLVLRNELALARSARKKISADKFLRRSAYSDMNITHIAQASLRQPSILEAEKYLDLERWKALEEIALGHFFDLEFLLIYAIKLSILERWVKINTEDKAELLAKVLPN